MKEIQYSSRTRASTDSFRRTQKLRAAFNELLKEMPPELAATPEAKLRAAASDPSVDNIVHLIYRRPTYEGHWKDYEFSRQPMEGDWRAGYGTGRHAGRDRRCQDGRNRGVGGR